jgi:hypothetical protein
MAIGCIFMIWTNKNNGNKISSKYQHPGIIVELRKKMAKQEKTKQDQKSQNTPQDKQNQQVGNQSSTTTFSDSCKVNKQFENYENISNPSITKKSFNDIAKAITGATANAKIKNKPINEQIKDKLNYTIWSLIYLSWSTEVGFETYENNFISLPLDLKINNSEITYPPNSVESYLKKSYFCLTVNNNTTALATFSNLFYTIEYMSQYLVNKIGSTLLSGKSIKTNNQLTQHSLRIVI